MKIAILTLRLFKNYGGILQNYALNYFLRKNGYETETINIVWLYKLSGLRKYCVWLKRLARNIVKKKWIPLNEEKKMQKTEAIAGEKIKAFKEKHIPLSKKTYYLPGADFHDINENYDTIVVGSDQVWRPKYTRGIKTYFLDFANEHIKKIAYAISFGTDENEYSSHERKTCGELLKKFDAISVREVSAISLMREKLHWEVNAIQTLDPTMLLEAEEYKALVPRVENRNEIFIYVLDDNPQKRILIEKVKSHLGIDSFTITPEGMDNTSTYVMPPVEEWLKALQEARFVVTDSFHGCVFSILFNKPFYVYGNKQRGKSRFESLLNTFLLQSRYVDEETSLNTLEINEDIDWNKVNDIIKEKRELSKRFLLTALEK